MGLMPKQLAQAKMCHMFLQITTHAEIMDYRYTDPSPSYPPFYQWEASGPWQPQYLHLTMAIYTLPIDSQLEIMDTYYMYSFHWIGEWSSAQMT